MWLFSVFILISRWQTSVNCGSKWETLVVLRTVVGFYLFMNYVFLFQKSHVEFFLAHMLSPSLTLLTFPIWIRVKTKLPNSEQSYKGKVKTHNYRNRQDQSTTKSASVKRVLLSSATNTTQYTKSKTEQNTEHKMRQKGNKSYMVLNMVLLWHTKGKSKLIIIETDKISQQPENCENRNDPDLVQAFLKKWWVESDFTLIYMGRNASFYCVFMRDIEC
jgi:hypothetical protein